MKKLVCLLAVLILAASCALADGIDLSGMTVEELQELRDQIDAELAQRSLPAEEEVIYEGRYCRIVLTSYEVTDYGSDRKRVTVNLEWTNLSQNDNALYWYLEVESWADGVAARCTKTGYMTDIRPDVTLPVSFTWTVSSTVRQLEVSFSGTFGGPVYRTMTFRLE